MNVGSKSWMGLRDGLPWPLRLTHPRLTTLGLVVCLHTLNSCIQVLFVFSKQHKHVSKYLSIYFSLLTSVFFNDRNPPTTNSVRTREKNWWWSHSHHSSRTTRHGQVVTHSEIPTTCLCCGLKVLYRSIFVLHICLTIRTLFLAVDSPQLVKTIRFSH